MAASIRHRWRRRSYETPCQRQRQWLLGTASNVATCVRSTRDRAKTKYTKLPQQGRIRRDKKHSKDRIKNTQKTCKIICKHSKDWKAHDTQCLGWADRKGFSKAPTAGKLTHTNSTDFVRIYMKVTCILIFLHKYLPLRLRKINWRDR